MVTGSPLVYRHARPIRGWLRLAAVGWVVLLLLVLAGQFLGATNIVPTPEDPLLAPFRWMPLESVGGLA